MATSMGASFMRGLMLADCPFGGLDKVLSTCLWLIPDRFSSHELAAEACRSMLGIIRVLYDGMSITASNACNKSFTWAMAVRLIRQVEVLYEMRASHLAALGQGNVFTSLTGLEVLKLFARLFLFNSSNRALTTLLPESNDTKRESDRNPECIVGAFKSLSESRLSLISPSWNSTRELRGYTAQDSLPSTYLTEDTANEDNDDDDDALSDGFQPWWTQVRSPVILDIAEEDYSHQEHSEFCYKAGQTMLLIGEMIYLIRPIVCVFALRRFGSRSWKPWLMSLGMDICSRILLSKGESIMKYAGVNRSTKISIQDQLLSYLTMVRNFQWSPVEKKEMKRRKALFLIYLMRSPVFEIITKPGLASTQEVLNAVPVLGKTLGKALELLYGIQRYYVYTSGNW